jgi:hypothetical protein
VASNSSNNSADSGVGPAAKRFCDMFAVVLNVIDADIRISVGYCKSEKLDQWLDIYIIDI